MRFRIQVNEKENMEIFKMSYYVVGIGQINKKNGKFLVRTNVNIYN